MGHPTVLPFVLAAFAATARAQPPTITSPQAEPPPRWISHFTVLAGNAAIGGLTAGILQELRGGSFQDGFTRGALGGSFIYVGKRVTVGEDPGAGFLGREIAAVGTSIVRNASDARPTFAELYLPVGPFPVMATVSLTGGARVRPQLDLFALAWMAHRFTEQGARLDLGRSLSSGMPVFAVRGRWLRHEVRLDLPGGRGATVGGLAAQRTILLSDTTTSTFDPEHAFRHERVHVLQQDFVLGAWSEPLTRFALGRVPLGQAVGRYLAIDGLGWVLPGLRLWLYPGDEADRFPLELEAEFLAPRPP